jgi:threonylcarbamoyladenosine tRNA methylthiotransferase MtaB
MEADMIRAGLIRADPAQADIILVNTCMVTGPTQAQCRKAIRQAKRANPGARLVVCGCMIRGARKQVEDLAEVDMVLDPGCKGMLVRLLGLPELETGIGAWEDWPEDPAVIPHGRDRAFLKIQDGCNSSCSFCVVPSVRDSSRSLEPGRVREAVRTLMGTGFMEVVLSGIHLGQYGGDLDPPVGLEELLEMLYLDALPGRIRLSSMEPMELTRTFLGTVAGGEGFFCRHIHVPIQSGSDRVLRMMNRPYTGRDLMRSLGRVKEALPGVGLGCDVICGFPGETGRDFAMTERVLSDYAIPFVHAFPYSPRPRTVAARLHDDVPHGEKKERVRRLRSIAAQNREAFARQQVGSALTVALETGPRGREEMWGLTDNYLRTVIRNGNGLKPGDLVRVCIEGVSGDILEGRPMGSGGGGNRERRVIKEPVDRRVNG